MEIVLNILTEAFWITVVGVLSLLSAYTILIVGGITIFTPLVLKSEIEGYYERKTRRMSPHELREAKKNITTALIMSIVIGALFGEFIIELAQNIIPIVLILSGAFLALVTPPLVKIIYDEKKGMDPYKQRVVEGHVKTAIMVAVTIAIIISLM